MLTTDPIPSFTEIVTPYLPLAGIVFGAIVVGVFGLWNRKRGAIEHRAPDVTEIWAREERGQKILDAERAHRRRLENFIDWVLGLFRGYVRRVVAGGSTTPTTDEQKALDSDPPRITDQ